MIVDDGIEMVFVATAGKPDRDKNVYCHMCGTKMDIDHRVGKYGYSFALCRNEECGGRVGRVTNAQFIYQ